MQNYSKSLCIYSATAIDLFTVIAPHHSHRTSSQSSHLIIALHLITVSHLFTRYWTSSYLHTTSQLSYYALYYAAIVASHRFLFSKSSNFTKIATHSPRLSDTTISYFILCLCCHCLFILWFFKYILICPKSCIAYTWAWRSSLKFCHC